VRVAAVVRDLMTFSRFLEAATRSGAQLQRFDSPADLPPSDQLDLVLVDWGDRSPHWGGQLTAWVASSVKPPRVILFGPHTDLDAHATAKRFGMGPVLARSKLMISLGSLLTGAETK
jgi:hypothetical protein